MVQFDVLFKRRMAEGPSSIVDRVEGPTLASTTTKASLFHKLSRMMSHDCSNHNTRFWYTLGGSAETQIYNAPTMGAVINHYKESSQRLVCMIQDVSLLDLMELAKYVELNETFLLEHCSAGQIAGMLDGTHPLRVIKGPSSWYSIEGSFMYCPLMPANYTRNCQRSMVTRDDGRSWYTRLSYARLRKNLCP